MFIPFFETGQFNERKFIKTERLAHLLFEVIKMSANEPKLAIFI
jgi:hypothetical protein|tara:strand:+ start:297 stop:428 length:132 start_codon:yes stop_codon:yes gene_type:complete